MKLTHARISGYKSIEDCELLVDPQITVLAGKSESGKTAVMQGLSRFSDSGRIETRDLCSWMVGLPDDHPLVTLTFSVEDADRESLEEIHPGFSGEREIAVSRNRDGTHSLVRPPLAASTGSKPPEALGEELTQLRLRGNQLLKDIQAWLVSDEIVDPHPSLLHVVTGLGQLVEQRRLRLVENDEIATRSGIEDYLNVLNALGDEIRQRKGLRLRGIRSRRTRIVTDLRSLLSRSKWETYEVPAIEAEAILNLLPAIRYLTDDDISPPDDSVAIEDLRASSSHDFLRGVLQLAGVDFSTLELPASETRQQTQRLNAGASRATEELRRYWSQENVSVGLRVVGSSLEVDLIGIEGHYGRPSEHSPGFQWFLSFVLAHLAPYSRPVRPTILLLDEPGLHLHAAAQVDLVKLLERSPSELQIVYVTHSPFMISKNFPMRVRAVVKREDGSADHGTKIDNKPYHSRSGRGWEPIRTALGISAGLSPFTAGKNLVVEGVNDQILLTAAAQRLAAGGGKPNFDLDLTAITFAGGANEIIPQAKYCQSEGISCVTLFDGDPKGERTGEKLQNLGFPHEAVALTTTDSDDSTAFDLEALVDVEAYHDLVIAAYGTIPNHPAKGELPRTFEEVKKEVESQPNPPSTSNMGRSKVYELYFRLREETWGGFSKKLVAEHVAEWLGSESLDSPRLVSTLDKFERLLNRLGERFANLEAL